MSGKFYMAVPKIRERGGFWMNILSPFLLYLLFPIPPVPFPFTLFPFPFYPLPYVLPFLSPFPCEKRPVTAKCVGL